MPLEFKDDVPEQYSREEVSEYMQELADTLQGLSIEIRQRIDEVSGKRVWAVVCRSTRVLCLFDLIFLTLGEYYRWRDCSSGNRIFGSGACVL